MKALFLIASVLYVWITPSCCQFFYSHYSPLSVSPIFPQSFVPTFPAVSPIAYTAPQPIVSRSSITYNIPQNPTQFLGFGYRTNYDDGASSTVFYVTGPEAQHLRNFKDIVPNFRTKISQGKARNLASDIIDNNAIPDAENKIESILKPTDFQKIFDTLTPGVVNFYTFPASTVPLTVARQLLNSTSNTSTTEAPDETIAAESVVNTKSVINNVDDLIKHNGTTEATSTSTTSEAPGTTIPSLESRIAETSTTESEEKSTDSITEETMTTESS